MRWTVYVSWLFTLAFARVTWRHRGRMFRVVQLDSIVDSLIWTFRHWCRCDPLPTINEWKITDEDDSQRCLREIELAIDAWEFLRPYFAQHGYYLYDCLPAPWRGNLVPHLKGPASHPAPSFPFSRRDFIDDVSSPAGLNVRLALSGRVRKSLITSLERLIPYLDVGPILPSPGICGM